MPSDRHLEIVRRLARKALAMATDGAVHRPRAGDQRVSLIEWVPLARAIVEGGGPTAPPPGLAALELDPVRRLRLTDGSGHHRAVYAPLAMEVGRLACGGVLDPVSAALIDAASADATGAADAAGFAAYRAALRHEPLVFEPTAAGSLQPPDADAAPDTWVFNELVMLHALHAAPETDPARVTAAAVYHAGHTQPDYTTYQPWALSAFLDVPDAVGFAEQQLHDVSTHLAVEGAAGALVSGLLLAVAVGRCGEVAKW